MQERKLKPEPPIEPWMRELAAEVCSWVRGTIRQMAEVDIGSAPQRAVDAVAKRISYYVAGRGNEPFRIRRMH